MPVTHRDEIGELRQAVNAFIVQLRTMIRAIAGNAHDVAHQSTELLNLSEQLSTTSETQNKETKQVADAMAQMVIAASEIAEGVSEAAVNAENIQDEADKGQRVVQETTQGINTLSNNVQNASDVVQRVVAQGEKIGVILEVINAVAEQTNLLALNASIEAARAGEHGRGFAVVAEEVRTLASRTRESTLEISEVISTLQSETKDAVDVMTRGQSLAGDSVEHAHEASESLVSLLNDMTSIKDKTAQIATAAEQQRSIIEEVDRSVDAIKGSSAQTSTSAHQVSNSSTELSRLAEHLDQLVGQFNV